MKQSLSGKNCLSRFCRIRFLWAAGLAFLLTFAIGCGGGVKVEAPKRISEAADPHLKEGNKIKADPVGYLKKLYARCEALEQYRLTFYRQERGNLFLRMGTMEEMKARFRKEPFSVKFDWNNPDSDYFESVYVAGANNDKLMVRQRKGFFGMAPKVLVLNVSDPVTWGKSKNPITNFGLAQVTGRTLKPFEDPEVVKVMTIKYQGVVDLDPMHSPAHYLLIERPKIEGLDYTRQDFYIDAETNLPAGTDLWLPNGLLDARYRYADVDTNISFSNNDFKLSKGHPAAEAKK